MPVIPLCVEGRLRCCSWHVINGVKEKGLRGLYFPYVAQANPPSDDEIAKRTRFRTGTGYGTSSAEGRPSFDSMTNSSRAMKTLGPWL